MYPLFRLLISTARAALAQHTTPPDTSEVVFRCRPWDLDTFLEMNNGRILTLYDLGRFDLAIRSGFLKQLRAQNWGLVVAGGSVRYRKRVRLFDKVTMKTRILGHDNRWIYMYQSMWVKGKPCSSLLVRTGVTSKGRTVDTQKVISTMGYELPEQTLPDWAGAWIEADNKRPWPP